MYCKNCGKEISEESRFCMFCGTPVEVIPSTVDEGTTTPGLMDQPADEPAPAAPEQPGVQEETFFAKPEPLQTEEPAPVRRERPVFDDIDWNVSDYPDSDSITKTEDIDFNWNARPEDIPEPVFTRKVREFKEDPWKPAPEPVITPAPEPVYTPEPEPVVAPLFEPAAERGADIDEKIDQVIHGEVPKEDLAVEVPKPEEEMSAADRIDKFYTFNRKNEEFQKLLDREAARVRSGNALSEEMSKADAIAKERFEQRNTESPQTMEDLFEAEGIVKPYQPKAFESDVLQRIEAQEAEREARRKEEEARKAAIEKARKEAEEARLRAERESEAARIREEEEARMVAEEARARAELEARESARAAEEAKVQAEREARAREEEAERREQAEAKIRAEEEARRVAEEEARIKAEAVARYQAQEEARIRAEEDLKAAQEAAKIKAQQEARLAAREQARFEAAREARRLEEEEAKKKLEAEQDRLAREANESIAAEEARKVLEQTARIRDEEAAKIRAAVADLRASTRAASVSGVSKEVAEAHKATQDQINEMAKARTTFFGEIDLAKELEEKDGAAPEAALEPEAPVLQAEEQPVTGRDTMLHGNMSDTKVFDKEKILAGISDSTIAASRDEFVGFAKAKPADVDVTPQPAEPDSIDDLLSQLESLDTTKGTFEQETELTLEDVAAPEVLAEVPEEVPEVVTDDTFQVPVEDVEPVPAPEPVPVPETPAPPVLEDTMVFGMQPEDLEGAQTDLSGTREFDFEGLPSGAKTSDTIIIGQHPEDFPELQANDFDHYGNAEADTFTRQIGGEADFNTVVPQEEPEGQIPQAAAAGAAAAALTPKAETPAKPSKKEQKAAAKEAKKAAKAAKKAPATDDGEEAPAKGGKGRGFLIFLLVLLCIVLAVEISAIGIRWLAPQSQAAEFVDNQLNKVIHLITGDKMEGQDVKLLSEEPRSTPHENYAEVVQAKADKNYNGAIQSLVYNADLKYDKEKVAGNADLELSMPIAEYEWGRAEDNTSVYYDEEVIGQAIAYESQRYELMKNGDESVLNMVSSKSMKGTLRDKKNSKPGEFKKLELGEVRVSGNYYYIWIKEHIGDKAKTRVLKMHPEEEFVLMMDRGYDI